MATAYNDQWVLKRGVAEALNDPSTVGNETARRIKARGLEGRSVSSPSSTWPLVRGARHRKPGGANSKGWQSI
jgi:hypothetical protein